MDVGSIARAGADVPGTASAGLLCSHRQGVAVAQVSSTLPLTTSSRADAVPETSTAP
jgi:hypothetical protein